MKPRYCRALLSSVPLAFIAILSACNSQSDLANNPSLGNTSPTVISNQSESLGESLESSSLIPSASKAVVDYGLTHQNPDGNRYLPGQINMPAITPLDIPLDGQSQWVVGLGISPGNSLWLVSLQNGALQTFLVEGRNVLLLDTLPQSSEAGTPPVLGTWDGQIALLNELADERSAFTHPIKIADNTLVSIAANGDLLINDEDGQLRLEVNALHDGRILSNGESELLLLTDPSSDYDHGIVGDALEARGVSIVTISEEPKAKQILSLPAQTVIEGISAIWADLDGDGLREIIITQSNAQDGAQIAVYNNDGQWLAASDPIGLAYRWRHQMAVAPFGPNGEMELASVFTPHIGGIVEFMQLDGEKLDVVARLAGYTSHVIGSRNLDMALAADVDADGQIELLLPNQNLSTLAAIQRTSNGAEVAWELELGDILASNLASARFEDGTIAIGAGLQSGLLRLWLP